MLKADLMNLLGSEFRLDWGGIHGAPHWARVRRNGLMLAKLNDAREDVVECFALIHDIQRMHDGTDPEHGRRAADYARKLNASYLHLNAAALEMLIYACEYHSHGLIEADVTVQTCWDADRLDLGRVGIRPDPNRLSTAPAKEREVLESAYRRSLR